MMRVAFVGAFAARLHRLVQDRLGGLCESIAVDEAAIMSRLTDLDVLVTLLFNREMAAASRRLKLVQVPAAGLDRIDPAALPPGVWLANAYGHEVGIAEFVIGSILAWNRGLCRADALLRRGEWDSQWPRARRRPRAPSSAGRRSASSGTGGSGRPSPAGLGPSTWRSGPSGAIRRSRSRARRTFSAGRTRWTSSWDAPTTWS